MRDRKILPTVTELNKYFLYDKDNGKLYWRKTNSNRKRIGDLAGCLQKSSRDYYVVCLFNDLYFVHRIIWKMHTWCEPPYEIDHKDTNTLNNKFTNLREADRHTNLANSRLSFHNRSGTKGVSFHKTSGTWRARIMVNYKDIAIGHFKTFEEAKEARIKYAKNLHGEFAREGDDA